MKQYRFKNEKEFEREYGKDWRKKLDWDYAADVHLGKLLDGFQNEAIDKDEEFYMGVRPFSSMNIRVDKNIHLKEIPQLSCDIDKVVFNDEKKRVTVILRNGNEGRSTCSPEDAYDPYVGFAVAYARAVAGSSTQLRKYVDMKIERQNKKKK